MTAQRDSWPDVEKRLRAEPAGSAPGPDHEANVLRAVRLAAAQAPARTAPCGFRWVWPAGAVAVAAALLLLLRPGADPQPAVAPAAERWSLATLDQQARAPLQQEWKDLQGDLGRTVSFLADCLPSPRT